MKFIECDKDHNLPVGEWRAGRGKASLGTFLWITCGDILCALGVVEQAADEAAFWAYRGRWYKVDLSLPRTDDLQARTFEQIWREESPMTSTLLLYGTSFQRSVWRALLTIPKGQTSTYGDLAKKVGHPKAVRAVGTAMGKNPIGLLIPCHRVLGTTGLGGYAWGLPLKKKILAAEGVVGL